MINSKLNISLYIKSLVFIYAVFIFLINIIVEKKQLSPETFKLNTDTTLKVEGVEDLLIFETNFATSGIVKAVHCSSAIELDDSKIRAFWYGGTREGSGDVDIFTSVFNLKTNIWSLDASLVTNFQAERDLSRYVKKLGNAVVVRDLKNRLWLFFVTVSFGGWSGSSINYIISEDEGKSWSNIKRLITSPFLNISTLVKGRPFLYEDGSIGLPVYHELFGKFPELLKISEEGNVLYKKRLTWGRKTLSPEVLPVTDKIAFCYLRYAGKHERFIYCLQTFDGGLTWSLPNKTDLLNHNSAFTCLKTKDDLILKVLNYSDKERDDLTLVVSKDFGKTWKKVFVFEQEQTLKNGTKHEFSYPWILQMNNGDFHLFYTWRRKHIKHIYFNELWLESML